MPNLKIFIDETLLAGCRDALFEALPAIRTTLCDRLEVDASACQFAIIPVIAMADQPNVNMELQIMPGPTRTRDVLVSSCESLRDLMREVTTARVAVRIVSLDPATYVALK